MPKIHHIFNAYKLSNNMSKNKKWEKKFWEKF